MEHRIVFREITARDIDRHCHFLPEEGEFERHLYALTQEARYLDGVTDVRSDGSHAIVVTTDETLDELKQKIIPLLQRHWAYLRIELGNRDATQA